MEEGIWGILGKGVGLFVGIGNGGIDGDSPPAAYSLTFHISKILNKPLPVVQTNIAQKIVFFLVNSISFATIRPCKRKSRLVKR